MIEFVHTNIITDNWKRLAEFYINVFGYIPLQPERDLKGTWLDHLTCINNAHIQGVHLCLPGYKDNQPTLEIFQYDINAQNHFPVTNLKGYGHIAFKVDNVEEVVDKIIANGGKQLGEIVRTEIPGAGYLTVVYTRDIDDNIIEIQNWRS